jgi:uncharacterized membrane protein SpoIIM required for sporulation
MKRKEVYFDRALSKSYWSWRKNQALIVPTMLSSSISVLTQSIFVIFGIILLLQLESNGSLTVMASAVASRNYSHLFAVFLSPSVFYPFLWFIVPSSVMAVLVSVLATGFSLSAEFVSYRKALDGKRVGVGEVLLAVKDKWKAMAWTNFLSSLIVYGPIILVGAGVLTNAGALVGNPLLLLGFLSLFGLAALASTALSFFLMYSNVSVALENVSGLKAVRRSFAVARNYFGVSFIYAIVRVVSIFVVSLVGVFGQFLSLPITSLVSLAISLLLVPVLHLTKTSIYSETLIESEMEFEIYSERSAGFDLVRGPFARLVLSNLERGLAALGRFVIGKQNVVYHLLSLAAFVIGVFIGSFIATHGLTAAIFTLGYQTGQINPTILRAVPLSEGFDIFFHNWLVSVSTALSGIWLVAPSLITLGFNGVILGVVYYLTPNASMFAAAIFPHGSIELPSFILAGSAGVKLGIAFLRTYSRKGNVSSSGGQTQAEINQANDRFREVAHEVIFVLIGLAVLFLIAGFIEGNITPIIMRSVGWH